MATSVKVGVSNVNLRLSVVYVDPATEINYVIPAASISYVGLQVAAELDITNRNPYVVETVFAVDSNSINVGKNFFEELNPSTDQIIDFNVGKGVNEDISFVESTSFISSFSRQFQETFELNEALGNTFTKLLEDSFDLSDEISKEIGVYQADSTIMYDQTDVFDGLEYQFGKGLQDIPDGILESSVSDVGKSLAESVTPTSNGLLYMTNYCDITYFAEDYVGISLTFT